MPLLKTLLVALALPPFGFVTLAAIALLLPSSCRRTARCMLVVGVSGLAVLAMPAVSGTLLAALETGLNTTPPAGDPPEAIVILGGEIARTPPPAAAGVGPLTLERLRAGAELARRTHLPVLVTGGLIDRDEPPVGRLMAESMRDDFGISVRWTEDESRDTWENASKSAEILRKAGVHSIYVVTHAWHMKRALQSFASTGLVVTPAPTPFDTVPTPILSDFVPRVSAWLTSYFALHEWTGRAWYLLR